MTSRTCTKCSQFKSQHEFRGESKSCLKCSKQGPAVCRRVHEYKICERVRHRDGLFHVRHRDSEKTVCGYAAEEPPFVRQGTAELLVLKNGHECCDVCRKKLVEMFLVKESG